MKMSLGRVLVSPGPGRRISLRQVVGPLALVTFVASWWMSFGPAVLGGPATFAIVDGRSMEPTYQYGDLVIARTASHHEIGDIVLFPSQTRRIVIHRIVGGDSSQGWTTRGDNNNGNDNWILPDASILGQEWIVIPKAGHALMWTQRYPWLFAGAVGVIVCSISLIGTRQRRLHPAMKEALLHARRVPPWEGRNPWEILLAVAAGASAVAAVVSLVLLHLLDEIFSAIGGFVAFVVILSACIGVTLKRRLIDGKGFSEPDHSKIVLSDQCHLVQTLPESDRHTEYSSALELQDFLRGRKLPVLRHESDDGTITFMTIESSGMAHSWTVSSRDSTLRQTLN